jgi:hypothetical protein
MTAAKAKIAAQSREGLNRLVSIVGFFHAEEMCPFGSLHEFC